VTVPIREEFIALVSSFKAAVGRHAEEYREAVHKWSGRHGWGYVGEDFDQIWDSITESRVGPDFLIRKARAQGWHGDAAYEFRDMDIVAGDEANDRHGSLVLYAPKGAVADLENVAVILRQNAPGLVAFDEMRQTTVLMKPPKWERDFVPRAITDNDVSIVQAALQKRAAPRRPGSARQALEMLARENSFHPVRDWLGSLRWDGVERAERLFPEYFGSEDTPYTREAGRTLNSPWLRG
jgi:hypothetical protein